MILLLRLIPLFTFIAAIAMLIWPGFLAGLFFGLFFVPIVLIYENAIDDAFGE
jgi:hypothetical protein